VCDNVNKTEPNLSLSTTKVRQVRELDVIWPSIFYPINDWHSL